MKGTGFFRRLLCVLLVSLLIIPVALADKVDLSSMSDDEMSFSSRRKPAGPQSRLPRIRRRSAK